MNPVNGDHGDAPATRELITEIAAIWRRVLDREDVGPDDDLFELGGHSLAITRIQKHIEARTGVEVPLFTFYDTPTVRDVAAAVESIRGEE